MQPNRFGGGFSLPPFWASIWSVVAYLFGLGLLQYIAFSLVTAFGLMPQAISAVLVALAVPFVQLAGTYLYIDWRWGWRFDNIGMALTPASAGWGAIGLVLGAIVAGVGVLLNGLMNGGPLMVTPPPASAWPLLSIVFVCLQGFALEAVFRGAAISRYQADMAHREVLLAATLTPFGWQLIQMLMPVPLGNGIDSAWSAAMSVALALIFIRSESAWFAGGLRAGTTAALLLLGVSSRSFEQGGLLVWGVVAVVLLALEWHRQQKAPRRVQSQPRVSRGRTVRGPWGPH